jgi:glutamate---cysteine ligase / carboxylate-amine ligase
LRPDLGTLEFRIADAQTSPECSGAIAAMCQALVAVLEERLRGGEQLRVQPAHVLAENRWRALRDGLSAELADPETGLPETARYRLARLLGELESHAHRLGSDRELAHAWRLLARNGADRQREVAAERGVQGLLEWLADCTEAHAAGAESIEPSAGEPLETAVLPL